MIQYKLRVLSNEPEGSNPSLITDAVITLINLELDGKTTSVQLNNGNKIINSLHLIRMVTMRLFITNRIQYNPISEWKELHTIHMNPGTVPDSSTFNILDTRRECEDNNKRQHAASIDDNNCVKFDETEKSNLLDFVNNPEMESPSVIEG